MNVLSKRIMALILSGASALAISTQFLTEKEGDRLVAYQDGVGIWTICKGSTKGVYKGMRLTAAQCAERDAVAIRAADADVERLVHVPMSNPMRAALISFCGYNLGYTKCSTSTFLRKLNAGDRKGACEQIKLWIKDGGKDCRVDKSCHGQLLRRDQEYELCLMD